MQIRESLRADKGKRKLLEESTRANRVNGHQIRDNFSTYNPNGEQMRQNLFAYIGKRKPLEESTRANRMNGHQIRQNFSTYNPNGEQMRQTLFAHWVNGHEMR